VYQYSGRFGLNVFLPVNTRVGTNVGVTVTAAFYDGALDLVRSSPPASSSSES
jgi:hypothetical protein